MPTKRLSYFGARRRFFTDRTGPGALLEVLKEERTMKRLTTKGIVIVAALLVVAILAGTAAYGYFTSGKTIANNEIKAGSIQLSVNDDGAALPINLPALMPGDAGTVGNYKIENIGDTAGTLWVGVYGDDNGVDRFFNEGLAQALQAAFWLDVANDGIWNDGDKYFVPNGMYQAFQTGDSPAVPAAAYNSLFDWNNGWSNTMDIPGAATAGTLKMTYSLPASVDDTSLMGKVCNFDLMVEIHQYHPDSNTVTVGSLSGHTGVTWTAIANGVVVDTGSLANGASNTVLTLPVGVYSIVFAGDNGFTYTKTPVDITVIDFGPFDLPA